MTRLIEILHPIVIRAIYTLMALSLPGGASGQTSGGEFRLSPLCEAIVSEDMGRAKRLIEQGADVNASYGCALFGTASRGHLNMVELLLDRGANPNRIVSGDLILFMGGSTPLVAAVQSRDVLVVRLLLKRGANPRNDFEAFNMVLNFSNVEMAELLLRHGANANMTYPAGGNVYAFRGEQMVQVPPRDLEPDRVDKALKRLECRISVPSEGTSLLHMAALGRTTPGPDNHDRIAKLLIDRGADPNARTLAGSTPLMLAASKHNHPVMMMLMKAGTDVKARDRCGRTAEGYADLYPQRLSAYLAPQTKALLQGHQRK
jgi:ankyrin repeat protein